MTQFIRAEVRLQQRPAVNPNNASYRPHLRVCSEGQYLGVCFVGGPVRLTPGEEARVTLALMYPGVDYSPLQVGAEFEVMEGPHVVGSGTVLWRGCADSVEQLAPTDANSVFCSES